MKKISKLFPLKDRKQVTSRGIVGIHVKDNKDRLEIGHDTM